MEYSCSLLSSFLIFIGVSGNILNRASHLTTTQGVNFKQHTYQKHSTTSNQPDTNTGIKDHSRDHKGSQPRSYYDNDNDKNKDDNNDDDDDNNNNGNRNDIDKTIIE